MIKCIGFGKSLKQLFIIGLISCFTLLGSSFVSAACGLNQVQINGTYIDNVVNIASGIHPVGTTYQSSNSSSYSIGVLRYGNFFTQSLGYGKKVFSPLENSMAWFDSDGLPYVYYSNGVQGNFSHYAICNEIDGSATYLTGCSLNSLSSSSLDIFKSFLSTVNSNDSFGYYYLRGNYYNYFNICISSSVYNKSLCFLSSFYGQGSSQGDSCYPKNSKSYSNLTFSNISQDLLFDSPGVSTNGNSGGGQSLVVYTGSRLEGIFGIGSGFTNKDMIDGYECNGYRYELCYGGFDINNIFDPSETFEDFSGYIAGQGASVFDLYNLYSGSFTSLSQFLQTVLTRYKNGQINQFKTEPKALLMLGSQLNVAGLRVDSVANYCTLKLKSTYSDIYTGNSLDTLSNKSCLRSHSIQDSLSYSSGNISLQTTQKNGIFSGEDIDFDPDTFFSNLMNKLDSKLNKPLEGTSTGLLPGYIVAFLLAFVFIRLISH